MASAKVAITLDKKLLEQVDRWVTEGRYPNRSQAIQEAVQEKVEHTRKRRLAEEAAKLDPQEERALAEEGFAAENEIWPAY